jgi:hypothetical protein
VISVLTITMLLYMFYNISSITSMFYKIFMIPRSYLFSFINIILDYRYEDLSYFRIGKVPQKFFQNSKVICNWM